MNESINKFMNELSDVLPTYIMKDLDDCMNTRKISYRKNLRQRLISKFDNLITQNRTNSIEDKWVVNISDRQLTSNEINVLQKGLKFNVPNKKNDIPQFIACIENVIENDLRNVSEDDKNLF